MTIPCQYSTTISNNKGCGTIQEWYNISGFDNYEITKTGNVRNKNTLVEFKPKSDKDGYLEVGIRRDGKRFYKRIHRLVAETFLPNLDNLPLVNHKNGIKNDNRVDNLEWCTYSYNSKHSFETLGRKGYNGGTNKVISKVDAITGEVLNTYNSITDASESVGVNKTAISHVINGRSKTCKGYNWVVVEEDVSTIESIS